MIEKRGSDNTTKEDLPTRIVRHIYAHVVDPVPEIIIHDDNTAAGMSSLFSCTPLGLRAFVRRFYCSEPIHFVT